jgi:lysophospholipase L1-like esterase
MRRLRILAVQLLLGFVTLELCLRIYNPLPFRVRGDRIVLPAGQVYRFDNHHAPKLDPITHHTKNSLGFRGPEPPRDFDQRLRILTVGGSTTECLFLSDGKTWTDRMARHVLAIDSTAWINNAGLDGQSTNGHLVLLRNFIVALKPNLVIFLVGANDVGLDSANGYDSALVPPDTTARRIQTFVIDHSEVVAVVQNAYRAAWTRQRGFGHSQIDVSTLPQRSIDEQTIDRTLQEHRTRYLDGYTRRLTTLAELCRANGIQPVFVTQPALFGEAVDAGTGIDLSTVQVNGRGNGTLEWRLLEIYNDVTRRVAAAQGLLLIDLAHEMPKDSRLFYDFLHFTNEGAAQVGDIVAQHLAPRLPSLRAATHG